MAFSASVLTPPVRACDACCLLSVSAASTLGAIPSEVISGQLTQRTPAGYITEQRIIDAYKKVRDLDNPPVRPADARTRGGGQGVKGKATAKVM
jgi:hypothetical protein